MGKNDFGFDIDFEKEYGFDPSLFMDTDEDGDSGYAPAAENAAGWQEPEQNAAAQDAYLNQNNFDLDEQEDEDLTAGIDFRHVKLVEDKPAFDGGLQFDEQTESAENADYGEEAEVDDLSDDYIDDGEDFPEDADEEDEAEQPKKPARRRREKPEKPSGPSLLSKFLDYYLAPVKSSEAESETADGRPRRRKKTKAQIFKEVYLPAIIAGVALLLIMVFIFGSVSNAFKTKKINDEKHKNDAISASNEAQLAEKEYATLIKDAEMLATGYDYDGAIKLLDSFTSDSAQYQQEITEKRSAYVNAQSQLQEWKDPSVIKNLSFHVLIADPSRAFSDAEYHGQYNRNFVTVEEFSRILDQLYSGGYVLVDYDSFLASNTGLDGNKSFFVDPIYLPDGKKPIMITETMVNYFAYMIDSNRDGTPDAGGGGFASRLIVDGNGDIKAELVDTNNQTQVGNYDLVPILEDFIKQHPDFSYRGARATLAVCGYEGIFGYRINTSYVSTMGQAYQEKEVADAKVLVQALRDKGYTLACYTYDNIPYRGKSVAQIQSDIQSWNTQIKPVLGDTDILVFAKTSDIDDYSGPAYQKLHENGFNIFVNNGTEAKADVNASFVRQTRLMVTGNAMAWYSSQFNGLFDCNVVLDMASRREVPNG